jgi:lipoprotein-releasing system permease protein
VAAEVDDLKALTLQVSLDGFLQGKTGLVPLDPENYFVSSVPVHMDLGWILTADIVAFAVIMLLLLIPCVFISKVDPADTVRVR